MRAVVYYNGGSGDVLKLEEIEMLVHEDDEVYGYCLLSIPDW